MRKKRPAHAPVVRTHPVDPAAEPSHPLHPPHTSHKAPDPTGYLTAAAFTFFTLVSVHKLTHASLWFDESIEYWYSKVMFGTLPFSDTTDMYQRIVSTLQPPLYNVLLYFWLKISDTEWWFRFFGVVMGCVGMAGLYKTIRKVGGTVFTAAGAVCFSACVYRLSYYWQEAAEYCLMLGALFWTLYFWLCLIQTPSRRYVIGFTISAIIPVYSQYGAAFPVAAMILSAYVLTFLRRDKRLTLELTGAYVCALLGAAVPLYVFFLRGQMSLQHGGAAVRSLTFEGGAVRDCLEAFHMVFRWCLTPDFSGMTSRFLMFVVIVGSVAVLVWGSRTAKALTVTNILTWFFYYFAVKLGFYADMNYGGFGNRYNLFILPMWIVGLFVSGMECYRILSARPVMVRHGIPAVYMGVMICAAVCLSVLSWTEKLSGNWEKEDIRGAVYAWYQYDAAQADTIVYYAADSGFAYYVRMNPGYNAHTEDRVVYMPWYADREEYRTYLDGLYGSAWPEKVYVAASHYGDDLATLVGEFLTAGYEREYLYTSAGDGYLVRLSR